MQVHLSHPWCQHRAVEKSSSRWIMTKKYPTYWRSVTCTMMLNLEWLQCVLAIPPMPSAKAINLRRASHRRVPHSAPTVPTHTPLAMTTVLHGMPFATAVPKEATGMQSTTALVLWANMPLSQMKLWRPCHQQWEKGKRADRVQVSTEEIPTCNELFADTINCGTAGDTHPEETVIDNIHAQRCNEAYTMLKLPASISSKGTTSLCVKVNTAAGGNVLSLHVFQHLHPDQNSPAGLPTGLDHVSTRLTAYNGSHIPLYDALCGLIVWQPGGTGIRPCKINSYCYIADTPSPAILGLPSCERLAIMKMNCAVTVMQPSRKPPSPVPASTTATKVKPATVLTAAKSIRYTDDLIKVFPDWFMGIGRFPGKYKIWLQHDVHPRYMPPGNAPLPCAQRSRNTDPQTGYPSLPTFRRQMVSYTCTWIPMTSMRPSAKIITRCPLWRKLLMSLHTLATSPSWMPAMDTGQLSLTKSPACSQHSTVPSEDIVSCNFPLASSVPKTSSRRRWIRS